MGQVIPFPRRAPPLHRILNAYDHATAILEERVEDQQRRDISNLEAVAEDARRRVAEVIEALDDSVEWMRPSDSEVPFS